jgi:hypothetical protein
MQLEALHGLWELAVNPSHQSEIPMVTLNRLVRLITHGDDEQQMIMAITIAWHLASNQTQRRLFADTGVVQVLTPTTSFPVPNTQTEYKTSGQS